MRTIPGFVAAAVLIASVAGCNASNQINLPPPGSVSIQNVYWGLGSSAPAPQIEVAAFPLTNTSAVLLTINGTVTNKLGNVGNLQFDSSGRLWVLNRTNPAVINVFNVPLTVLSAPVFSLTFPDVFTSFGFTLDAQGNLWISSVNPGNDVFKYAGPFSGSASLPASSAQLTLTAGLNRPEGLAFAPSGDLFVANEGVNTSTSCVGSIAEFKAPISNTAPTLLNGPNFPVALVFDAAGNLYAASIQNTTSGCVSGIARYNSGNFAAGATPNIVDATGLPLFWSPLQMSVDAIGNLYVGNCDPGPISVFPSVATQFSNSLAPTTTFTDANIAAACSTGVIAR